jgi:hypothetical protein
MRPVVYLFGLLVSSVALGAGAMAQASPEYLGRSTPKSLDQFAQCFASTQDRAARPWWYVPYADGGLFSDSRSGNQDKGYFLRIRDIGGQRQIAVQSAAQESAITRAVDTCL